MSNKKKNTQQTFHCPFCKKEIVASQKTEIHYRSNWVNGCYSCFILSISKPTALDFQQRDY